MNPSRFFRVLQISSVLVLTLAMTGCTGKITKNRVEAEKYAKENPGANPYDIRIDNPDGSYDFLGEIQDKEKANGKSPVKEGEVMKYEEPVAGTPVELLKVGNDNKVTGGGTPTPVLLEKAAHISEWWTYHWTGKDKAPGTISLKSGDGKTYGPWQATLVNGVYWKTEPGITLPAGSYTVIDSDPETWSQNAGTSGHGSTWAIGWVVEEKNP
ncbi:MAG: hypothetical protein WCJ29_02735 [bacterium]